MGLWVLQQGVAGTPAVCALRGAYAPHCCAPLPRTRAPAGTSKPENMLLEVMPSRWRGNLAHERAAAGDAAAFAPWSEAARAWAADHPGEQLSAYQPIDVTSDTPTTFRAKLADYGLVGEMTLETPRMVSFAGTEYYMPPVSKGLLFVRGCSRPTTCPPLLSGW